MSRTPGKFIQQSDLKGIRDRLAAVERRLDRHDGRISNLEAVVYPPKGKQPPAAVGILGCLATQPELSEYEKYMYAGMANAASPTSPGTAARFRPYPLDTR